METSMMMTKRRAASCALILLACLGAAQVAAAEINSQETNKKTVKRRSRHQRRKLDEEERDLPTINTDGAEITHGDGMWMGEVENILDEDKETSIKTNMEGDCVNPDRVPTMEIDLGLGNDAFLEEIVVYHKQDGSKYCNQKVSVSTDGDNWQEVYNTRANFGPEENGDGVKATFPRTRVRHVQIQSGGGATEAEKEVVFAEVELKGLDRRTRPRVSVSENGHHVLVTVNNELWKMNGLYADGSWEKVEGDVELQHAEIANDEIIAAVSKTGSIFVGKPGDWGPSRGRLKTVDLAGDGSMVIGAQEKGDVYWSELDEKLGVSWKGINGKAQDVMANADGSMVLLATPEENHIHALQTRKLEETPDFEPTKLELPDDIKVLQAVFGGKHEIWLVDTEYELWHAWIQDPEEGEPRFQPGGFEKMEIRVLNVSATWRGAVFGAALDGTGIIYCRHRDFERFSQRCEYLRGPWGRTPDRSYTPRQAMPTRSQGAPKLQLNLSP